jgi:hypothetical protein
MENFKTVKNIPNFLENLELPTARFATNLDRFVLYKHMNIFSNKILPYITVSRSVFVAMVIV